MDSKWIQGRIEEYSFYRLAKQILPESREYKYGDKYYLVLADANDEKNILQQYEFMIDIAFVDDFGF